MYKWTLYVMCPFFNVKSAMYLVGTLIYIPRLSESRAQDHPTSTVLSYFYMSPKKMYTIFITLFT